MRIVLITNFARVWADSHVRTAYSSTVDTILNRDIKPGGVAKGNVVMDVVWPKGVSEIEAVAVPR